MDGTAGIGNEEGVGSLLHGRNRLACSIAPSLLRTSASTRVYPPSSLSAVIQV